MKICAIVQARMGSTRLPGKVLREIMGKPMLLYLINQVNGSTFINDLIIATTTKKEDDAIESFAGIYSFKVYRGSENDIVDRFYNAGKICNADIVVRIWGDCPLIDPKLIDKSLEKFIDTNYDYANNFNPPTYPAGMNFEVYSFTSLKKIWEKTNDPFYREYPFEYIYAHENSFKTFYDKNDVNLSHINLTVDYIQDFELITKIFEELYKKDLFFQLKDILEFLNKYPEFGEQNKDLKRNIEYKEGLQRRNGEKQSNISN